MEELQIQEFVHRVAVDEATRRELSRDPMGVVRREGFSQRVAQVIFCLVPHIAFAQPLGPAEKWWHA